MKLVSWDGNNINDGTNYDAVLNANFQGLPGVKAIMGKRHGNWPILGGIERPGRELNIDIYIRSGTSLELAQWFDPEDETAKQLIVEDPDGQNDRFVKGICTEFREVPLSAGLHYAVSVQVDGDVRWRLSDEEPTQWSITASGQTQVFANNGEDKAYPILKIQPTAAKGEGFSYKIFCVVRWNASGTATTYPVDIVNNSFGTDALTPAKMQADGDDLRVYVDSVEVDRWLQDMDTASTQVWCNLDFEANIAMTLNGAHNDAVTEIDVNEDISNMPVVGMLYIGTELITYTGKNNQQKQFTGCTRGAKGTSAAAQGDTDPVYWIQHDIWIYYGDSTLSAPSVDASYKPMFLLSSTNASWDFDDFGETAEPTRPAQWQRVTTGGTPEFYGSTQGADADPWAELGIHCDATPESGLIQFNNPCGITSANFTNGEHKASDVTFWVGAIGSDIISTEYSIPAPGSDDTWDTWSRNETLGSGAKEVYITLNNLALGLEQWLECADCALAITSSPTIVVGSEQSNYQLSCTITNNTTGDAIEVAFNMEQDEELEVDTDEKTLIYLADNSNQFNALGLVGGPRKLWLPFDVGNNTLQFDDVDTGNVTIAVSWWKRYYE